MKYGVKLSLNVFQTVKHGDGSIMDRIFNRNQKFENEAGNGAKGVCHLK